METKVLNYRIIIKPEKENKKTIYLAECLTFGVYDWGGILSIKLLKILEKVSNAT